MRIVVSSPVSSGSAYAAEALARYFGAALSPRDITRDLSSPEHGITAEFLAEVSGTTFVADLHVRPSLPNVRAARANGIDIVVVWRNLADVVVAVDETLRGPGELDPAAQLPDREPYASLPDEERYAYLINTIVPPALAFYLGWRRQRVPIFAYERLVDSPLRFLSDVLRAVLTDAGEERLAAVVAGMRETFPDLDAPDAAALRFTTANRRHLERVVAEHPHRHELEVLLRELPWEVPALRSTAPHDGALVGAAGPALYFVSRGIRRLVPDLAWIAARRRVSADAVVRLSGDELGLIPEGRPLV